MAIIEIIGVRHGKAAAADGLQLSPASKREEDLARPLNRTGLAQATLRGRKMRGTKFHQVFSSPAERALHTAERVSNQNRIHFNVMDQLYTPEGPDAEIHDKLFAELGYAPPSAYIEHPLNQLHKTGWNDSPVERLGVNAGSAIAPLIRPVDGYATILVAGHAVFTPLAVKGIVDAMVGASEEVRAFLDELNMVEAGAFRVTLYDRDLTETTFELYE